MVAGDGIVREEPCSSCGRLVLALLEGLCGRCVVNDEFERRAHGGNLSRADLSERAYNKKCFP